MTSTVKTMGVAIILAGGWLGAGGCQNIHQENVQMAEARWSRARASVMLQVAEQQYKSGQLDKALVTVGQAAGIDPSLARLQVVRGQILAEKGQGQEALGAFQTAMAVDPRDPQPHYFAGVQYEKWAQFDKALAQYQMAAELAPDNVAYPVAVAETLGHLNRTAEALSMIDRLLANQSQSVALRVTAGQLCQAQGDYERAVGYFRDAARLATDDTSILRSLAMALYRAGRYAEARGYLEQLANQRPGAEPTRTAAAGAPQMASMADSSGLPANAPAEPAQRGELLAALGECYLNLNQPALAQNAFAELTMLWPKRPCSWIGRGKAALCQGKWDEAARAGAEAVALAPDAVGGHLLRGYALIQSNRPQEAVRVFQQAHRLAPRDILMLCLLAESYRQAGDAKSAREALVRAMQIAPDDPLASQMINELASAEFGQPKHAGSPVDNRPLAPPTVTAGVVVPD